MDDPLAEHMAGLGLEDLCALNSLLEAGCAALKIGDGRVVADLMLEAGEAPLLILSMGESAA